MADAKKNSKKSIAAQAEARANKMASNHEKAKKSGKKTGIAKYFKDLRSEIKKVTWPSWKKVRNNTFVVLVGMCASAVVIFGIDSVLTILMKLVNG